MQEYLLSLWHRQQVKELRTIQQGHLRATMKTNWDHYINKNKFLKKQAWKT